MLNSRVVQYLCISVGYAVFLALLQQTAVHADLIVEDYNPKPNYKLTTDSDDLFQLTDGEFTAGKMWLKSNAVGWARRTPVIIRIRDNSETVKSSVLRGLRLRVAAGKLQGVNSPRRIDIYGFSNETGEYFHIGEYVSDGRQPIAKSHWITVPVQPNYKKMELVIHAEKAFIFLDEIEIWNPNNGARHKSIGMPLDTARDPKTDSLMRLQKQMLVVWEARHPLSEMVRAYAGQGQCVVRFESCWTGFNLGNGVFTQNTRELIGYTGEYESVCLAVANASAEVSDIVMTVSGMKDRDSLRSYEVKTILAANGSVVYDPLDSIRLPYTFNLDRDNVRHFMFVIPIADKTPNEMALKINDNGDRCSDSLQLKTRKTSLDASAIKTGAVVWGYPEDGAIWKNKDLVIKDLQFHGSNFNVVHPSLIMPASKEKRIVAADFVRLTKHVRQFGDNTRFLLFMALENENRLMAIGLKNVLEGKQASGNEFSRFRHWLDNVSAVMDAAGASDRWWLYPFDESNDEELRKTSRFGQKLKAENIQVRIYANPSQSGSIKTRTTLSGLMAAGPYVDLWQPRLALIKDHAGRFFRQLKKPWFIYRNPPAPAKAASPLIDYRLPSWRAWLAGASGFGFWSYSDTGNSSAWNDFDGKSPDWAVVYESESGPVPSVRWEAYREGIEDLRLLLALDAAYTDPVAKALRRRIVDRTLRKPLDVEAVETARQKLLEMIPSN